MTQASAARLPLIVVAASFGFLVTQLDVTIVNVALDAIGKAFDAPMAELQWVVDAYVLALAAMLLSAGALGDRIGPRKVFLAGLVLFAVASAACGLANGPAALIAARVAQGAAGALLVPPSLALIAHACHGDDAKRAWAVGWWTAAGGVSIAAGPVLGGLLIAALDWRWVFLVNLPLCAIGVALTLAVIPEAPPKAKTPLDLPGQALALIAVTALVGAVIEGGRRGWGHPGPALALVFGLLAVAAFLWVEARSAHPVAPLSMFRQRAVSTAVLVGSALNFSYYGLVFVLGLYLQRAVNYPPAEAGLAFLPLTATFIVSNLVSGGLVARHGAARVTTVGVLIAAVGYALTARLGAGSSFLEMLPGFLMIPGGMGLAIPALTSGLLASVDRGIAGAATGVLNACRQAGGAAGVAVFGALAAGGPERIVSGLRASGVIAAGMLVCAAWVAGRSSPNRQ
jgi:DHA2 family methylenomycin A resistance protein-like MFS transporter